MQNKDYPRLLDCPFCGGEKTLYQSTYSTKLFLNTLGEARTIETEVNACPPYADCCMKNNPVRAAFIINFCPECGRPLNRRPLERSKDNA